MQEYIAVGKITSTHGLRGFVKVMPLTDSIHRFKELKKVTIETGHKKLHMEIKIAQLNEHKNMAYVLFEGIDDVDQAQLLRNSLMLIPKEEVPQLPEYSYYHFEIIGLAVYDESDTYLGKVNQILETGANDVYVLADTSTDKPILIPALKTIVKTIDLEKGKMIINPPPGLLDI